MRITGVDTFLVGEHSSIPGRKAMDLPQAPDR